MKSHIGKKIILLTLILSFLVPAFMFPLEGTNIMPSKIVLNEEDTKLNKVILYKRGNLGNIISFDIYHFQLKADREYYFRTKINIPAGAFSLSVGGPGGSYAKADDWQESDPAGDRVIEFLFTPSDSGDHSITVASIIASDGGSYTLYANQSGFAGWWWILASGVGILVILIVLIALIIRGLRPKKKKRKRRK